LRRDPQFARVDPRAGLPAGIGVSSASIEDGAAKSPHGRVTRIAASNRDLYAPAS